MKFIAVLLPLLFVGCGKNEPITQLKEGSHILVSESGKFIETVGRTPRIVANKLLGANEDTNEDLETLENEVEEIYQELTNDIFELTLEVSDLKEYINTVKEDGQDNKEFLLDSIDDIHGELLSEIRKGDKKTLKKIRKLRKKVRNFRSDIRDLENLVDGIEVECERFKRTRFLTYCEIVNN